MMMVVMIMNDYGGRYITAIATSLLYHCMKSLPGAFPYVFHHTLDTCVAHLDALHNYSLARHIQMGLLGIYTHT